MDKKDNECLCPDCRKKSTQKETTNFEEILNTLAHIQFDTIWSQEKSELKSLSKKELAEEMFLRGIEMMTNSIEDFNDNSV